MRDQKDAGPQAYRVSAQGSIFFIHPLHENKHLDIYQRAWICVVSIKPIAVRWVRPLPKREHVMVKRSKIARAVWAAGMLAVTLGWFGWAMPASAGESKPQPYLRVIGGTEVPKGQYPFMVSVQFDKQHRCGGSVFDTMERKGPFIEPNQRYQIITAAHCVTDITDENAHRYSVTIGQTDLKDKIGSQRRNISKVWISAAKSSDLAVLTLDRPIKAVLPVRLPTLGTDALYGRDQKAIVMGWGNTDPYLDFYPNRLREVKVPLLSMAECKAAYPANDLRTYFCAGVRGKDSCQGDSGGPIIRSIAGRAHQIGVVSYGGVCADEGKPGVYTRLSSKKLWEKFALIWPEQAGSVDET